MPEALPDAGTGSDAEGASQTDGVLLMIVVASPESMDELVTGMLDVGVGGTLVDAKGLAAHLREEMPIFSGLAALLPQTTGSRIVFSVARRKQAEEVLDYIESEMRHGQRPLAFIVPLERIVGLRT